MRSLRNLKVGMQSQDSENVQRNIKIVQILRLRGTEALTNYAYSLLNIAPDREVYCQLHIYMCYRLLRVLICCYIK